MNTTLSPFALKHDLAHRSVDVARTAAMAGLEAAAGYLADPANRGTVACALRIRAVETSLYDLFGAGKLHGTIHTCLGQEFSGAVLSGMLRGDDFVTSNHRCHGHFIGATDDWRGLIDEIVGNQDGVCAGIGSSQHLWARNFVSNGQQGGLLPVAAGVALDRKMTSGRDVVVSFLGEGTLGEGIVYETFNLASLWQLPHVIVCENNFYSQSTPQEAGVAGLIADRGAAFGMATETADTWDLPNFAATLARCIARARDRSQPSFLVLTTYRLNPHSKGDDQRDKTEIEWFRACDPATMAMRDHGEFRALYDEYRQEAMAYADLALSKPSLPAASYFATQLPAPTPPGPISWQKIDQPAEGALRIAQQLNAFYAAYLQDDETAIFLGEDIADPYGGAFKIAKGLGTAFGDRVRTTPISEAAITGIGIGAAIAGRRAFVEIMFGDFITYAQDQLVNNASKMFHMYNRHLDCPVVVRTPMGGRRGYGPTHSQSLERFLIGIDNVCTISVNSLVPVDLQLASLQGLHCPVILLENKSDYTARTFVAPEGLVVETDGATLPSLRIRPHQAPPDITLLAYGGMARFVADALVDIFTATDMVPELLVIGGLSPVNLAPILDSVARTGRLVVIEEGAGFGSVGAEVIAQLSEAATGTLRVARVSGKPVPIPSAPKLEAAVLPSVDDICAAILRVRGDLS